MDIKEFGMPRIAPMGLLYGKVMRASEAEDILAWALGACIKAGKIIPVNRNNTEAGNGLADYRGATENLIKAGYLIEVGEQVQLTEKALEALFTVYGKE